MEYNYKTSKTRRYLSVLAVFFVMIFIFTGCAAQSSKYQDEDNWAYQEENTKKDVDCFLICPTVYSGTEDSLNMPVTSKEDREAFTGALNMEEGIYADTCNMFAPFYRQAALEVYTMDDDSSEKYFDIAYADVKESFTYYMKHENDGRPLILAGFSQGADMCLRLMKEFYDEDELQDQLIACYAIGWRITEDDLTNCPYLKMARGRDDTGVIVSFNTESKSTEKSMIVPDKTYGINPLNWETGSSYADASLNEGACFTDYSGAIVKEIPNLTGAYLDPERGTLKVDDSITPEDYPPVLDIFEDGIYHLYDYQFFYRNLQENVEQRAEAYAEE